MNAQNVISRKDFQRLMVEMVKAVDAAMAKHLTDAATIDAIEDDIAESWNEIRLQ